MSACKTLDDLLDLFQRLVVQHMCDQGQAVTSSTITVQLRSAKLPQPFTCPPKGFVWSRDHEPGNVLYIVGHHALYYILSVDTESGISC